MTPAPNAYQADEFQVADLYGGKKKGSRLTEGSSTFGMRPDRAYEQNYNPGPGSYEIAEVQSRNAPQFSIGTSVRKSQEHPVYTEKYYDSPNIFRSPEIRY